MATTGWKFVVVRQGGGYGNNRGGGYGRPSAGGGNNRGGYGRPQGGGYGNNRGGFPSAHLVTIQMLGYSMKKRIEYKEGEHRPNRAIAFGTSSSPMRWCLRREADELIHQAGR